MPADRTRKTVFDHSFNGMPDNFRSAGCVGASTEASRPPPGLSGRATAERRPSYPLAATIATSTPTQPGSWLNSTDPQRRGRTDCWSAAGHFSVAGARDYPPATPAFEPDAVHSPDGYFAGNSPTAFPAIASSTAVPSFRNATSQGRDGSVRHPLRKLGFFSCKHPRKRSIKSLGIRRRGASHPPSLFEDRPVVSPIVETLSAAQATVFPRIRRVAIAGRLAALAGIDPANPDPRVPTPAGNGFYNERIAATLRCFVHAERPSSVGIAARAKRITSHLLISRSSTFIAVRCQQRACSFIE